MTPKHPIPPTAREKRIGASRMKLPFDNRRNKGGWAAWIYHHRIGLLVTTVIYLSAAIMFMTYKIIILPAPSPVISMEFEQEQIIEQIQQQQQQQVEQIDYAAGMKVANKASDQNAKYDAALKDDRSSSASDIYAEAERVQQQMKAGSEAYARSMKELSDKRGGPPKLEDKSSRGGSKDGTADSKRFKGNVAVSYDLAGRSAVYLHHPTYQCQGGGQVVISITVNRNGKVTNADVDKASSTSDQCILEMAVKAAQASTFNASASAPDRQHGTITYTFVPQ